MLTLVTGKPGTGKTQYVIARFILEERKDNPNRRIYTNIKGLKLDKLQALTGGELVGPAPDDWRELPDGSLVIYDEAQQEHLFPATGRPGAPTDERLLRFDTHRHRGFDIVLVTQEASLIHHWARKFVGRFISLERHDGIEATHVSEWEEVVDPSDYHAKQRADKSTRAMDRRIWDVYHSATVHTHKFKVPAGAKMAIRFILFIAVVLALVLGGMWAFAQDNLEDQVSQATGAPVDQLAQIAPYSQHAWRAAATVQPINGCASSERRCRCWDFNGGMLDLDEATCRNLAEGNTPMPIDLNRFQGQGGAVERGGRDAPPPTVPASPLGSGGPAPAPIARPSGLHAAPPLPGTSV
jgi:zona occludens toxin (predicted ATPase)